MAIFEQHREDLLAEATKYVWRLSLHVPDFSVSGDDVPKVLDAGSASTTPINVFWGEESNSRWSLFLGDDLVLHLDEHDRLRRVFLEGRKLAAASGRLEELSRSDPSRRGGRLKLTRRQLSTKECNELVSRFHGAVVALQHRLSRSEFEVVGRVPTDSPEVERRFRSAIERTANKSLKVANSV